MEEINEGADKCHEPETHDEFAWAEVNNCKLDPPRVREARETGVEYFLKMQFYNNILDHKCKDVTGKMPIKSRGLTQTSKTK